MKRGQDFESSAFENESKFKLAKDNTEFKVDESSWIYKFAEKNNDIIDEVIDIEDELYDLNEKLNDDEMYLGDLEKNRFKKEIEKLSFERNEILDKLIEQIPAINGKTNVREVEGLEDVLEYIFDKKNAESEEAGHVEMESDEEENAYDYGLNEEAFDDYYGDCRDIMQMIKDRIEERENEELKRTDDDAKKKAESVRRKISELPNEIDRKDIFDPQSELLNILKISRNETGGMEKKKAALKIYKNELAKQMLGTADINVYLEKEICENKSLELTRLEAYLQKKAKEFKLSSWQIKRYEKFFNHLNQEACEIAKFRSENKGKKSKELHFELFDLKSEGDVNVETGKLVIEVHCFEASDFAKIYLKRDKISEEDLARTQSIGGFACYRKNMPVIVVNESNGYEEKKIEEILVHEKKHIVDNYLENALRGIGYEECQSDAVYEKYLQAPMELAKEETLAYFKDGTDVMDIYKLITHSSEYVPYFSKKPGWEQLEAEYLNDEKLRCVPWREFTKTVVLKYRKEIRRTLKENLSTLFTLESLGFPREKIIAIFQNVPFELWEEHIFRLGDSEFFMKEVEKVIKQKLEYHNEVLHDLEYEAEGLRKGSSIFARLSDRIKGGRNCQVAKGIKYAKREIAYLRDILNEMETSDHM